MTPHKMAHRVGRPPGLTVARIEKRYIIAGALLAGIKIAMIARQLNVSRSWASREANAPGTRFILAKAFEANRQQMSEVFDLTLNAIREAMTARKLVLLDGSFVDCGPDHYVRLEAVKMFILLMRAAKVR